MVKLGNQPIKKGGQGLPGGRFFSWNTGFSDAVHPRSGPIVPRVGKQVSSYVPCVKVISKMAMSCNSVEMFNVLRNVFFRQPGECFDVKLRCFGGFNGGCDGFLRTFTS